MAKKLDDYILKCLADGIITVDFDKGIVLSRKGKKMGYQWKDGYIRIHLRNGGPGHVVRAHRVIWLAKYGKIKDGYQIDHRDRNRDNNKPDNLREVTPKVNSNNRGGIYEKE